MCSKSRLSNHKVPPGSSENPYGEARSVELKICHKIDLKDNCEGFSGSFESSEINKAEVTVKFISVLCRFLFSTRGCFFLLLVFLHWLKSSRTFIFFPNQVYIFDELRPLLWGLHLCRSVKLENLSSPFRQH